MPPLARARSRRGQLESLGNGLFDVLILGGGITGVAAANVLVARGYRVALIDDHDFASGTSQESSQLIWGGIKYLEQGHAGLVAKLCAERNALVRGFPSRVAPLRFLYPHYKHDKHSLLAIQAGAYLYWALGRGYDRGPQRRSAADIHASVPQMRDGDFGGGLEYSDARMIISDARLVLDFLFDAMDAGLTAANYVSWKNAAWRNDAGAYSVDAVDQTSQAPLTIRARWIVNTTGCWVDQVNDRLGIKTPYGLLYSKGIHLVIPKIETSGRALTCLAADGRVFFVIPWGGVTLVGTTDTPFDAPPQRVSADAGDIEYLRGECEAKFKLTLREEDILNTKAGLRPLLRPKSAAAAGNEDFLALARSHKVWSDPAARVTSLWGGKYTDAFLMGREIADQVAIRPSASPRPVAPVLTPPPLDPEKLASGAIDFEALGIACERELVVRLEDLLRRRTNIALQVAGGGQGPQGEHASLLERIARSATRNLGLPG